MVRRHASRSFACLQAFAAAPGHPLLGSVLDTVVPHLIAQDVDPSILDFVHAISGPAIFTAGLLRKLLVGTWRNAIVHDDNPSPDLYKLLALRQVHWAHDGVCVVTGKELLARLTNKYSSQGTMFRSSTWSSWTKQANELTQSARAKKPQQDRIAPAAHR
jgi:hypothetical protein